MTNYSRGADFERRVRDMLIQQGAICVIRSAGSRGCLDLVAWMENGDTLFVQCKLKGAISREERDTLRDMAEAVSEWQARPVHAVIASRGGKGRIKMERIDGAETPGSRKEPRNDA